MTAKAWILYSIPSTPLFAFFASEVWLPCILTLCSYSVPYMIIPSLFQDSSHFDLGLLLVISRVCFSLRTVNAIISVLR